jgi:hypothetical protein
MSVNKLTELEAIMVNMEDEISHLSDTLDAIQSAMEKVEDLVDKAA